jgi:hypothetical protein
VTAHRTRTVPLPVDGQYGVATAYRAVCSCGWVQGTATPKTSLAWRAAKRHRARA